MQYFPLKLVILHEKLAIFTKNMGTGEKIQKLIQRLKSNDAEAFHELYNSFAPVLYRYLYSLLHSKEDTEDILHNVFCCYLHISLNTIVTTSALVSISALPKVPSALPCIIPYDLQTAIYPTYSSC